MNIPDIKESMPAIITIMSAIALTVSIIFRLKSFSPKTTPNDEKVKNTINTKKEALVNTKSKNPLNNQKATEQQRQKERESILGNVTTAILLMDFDNDNKTNTSQSVEAGISKVSSTKIPDHEPTQSPVSQATSHVGSGARSGGDGGCGGGATPSGSSE
ncbi:hypothetical protein QTV49_004268 [Vibrio vulnificus]|nr:hypothetical protein [Vibrio vulnificus]